MSEKKKEDPKPEEKVDLGLLEEDDEFEEFAAEQVEGNPKEEDMTIWEDNWDDDNIEDDFCKQLKQELDKQKLETEQMQ